MCRKSHCLRLISGKSEPDFRSDWYVERGYHRLSSPANESDDTTTVINETVTAFSELISLSEEMEYCSSEIARREIWNWRYLKLCDHLTVLRRVQNAGGTNYMAEADRWRFLGWGLNEKILIDHQEFKRRMENANWTGKDPSQEAFSFSPWRTYQPPWYRINPMAWNISCQFTPALWFSYLTTGLFSIMWPKELLNLAGKIYDYKASWSKYLYQEERREQQIASYRNQQKMIEDTEKFIERFRYKLQGSPGSVKDSSSSISWKTGSRWRNKSSSTEVPPAPRSGLLLSKQKTSLRKYGSLIVLIK